MLRRCWRKSHQEEHSAGHGGKSQPNGRGVCEDIGQVKICPRGYFWHTLVFREDPEAYAGFRGLATKEAAGRGSMRARDRVQQVWTCERQRTRAVRRCQGQGGSVWLREKRLSLTTRGIRSAIPRIQGDGGATLRGRRALLGQTWRLDKGVWSWSCFSSSICTLKKKLSSTALKRT